MKKKPKLDDSDDVGMQTELAPGTETKEGAEAKDGFEGKRCAASPEKAPASKKRATVQTVPTGMTRVPNEGNGNCVCVWPWAKHLLPSRTSPRRTAAYVRPLWPTSESIPTATNHGGTDFAHRKTTKNALTGTLTCACWRRTEHGQAHWNSRRPRPISTGQLSFSGLAWQRRKHATLHPPRDACVCGMTEMQATMSGSREHCQPKQPLQLPMAPCREKGEGRPRVRLQVCAHGQRVSLRSRHCVSRQSLRQLHAHAVQPCHQPKLPR